MKKLILTVLILWLAFVFYKKFFEPVIMPFFQEHKSKVDFMGLSTPSYNEKNLGGN